MDRLCQTLVVVFIIWRSSPMIFGIKPAIGADLALSQPYRPHESCSYISPSLVLILAFFGTLNVVSASYVYPI